MALTGMTSTLHAMKIYHLVQTLLGGHRDRLNGHLISVTFRCKESTANQTVSNYLDFSRKHVLIFTHRKFNRSLHKHMSPLNKVNVATWYDNKRDKCIVSHKNHLGPSRYCMWVGGYVQTASRKRRHESSATKRTRLTLCEETTETHGDE
jgi:hypothetical protein